MNRTKNTSYVSMRRVFGVDIPDDDEEDENWDVSIVDQNGVAVMISDHRGHSACELFASNEPVECHLCGTEVALEELLEVQQMFQDKDILPACYICMQENISALHQDWRSHITGSRNRMHQMDVALSAGEDQVDDVVSVELVDEEYTSDELVDDEYASDKLVNDEYSSDDEELPDEEIDYTASENELVDDEASDDEDDGLIGKYSSDEGVDEGVMEEENTNDKAELDADKIVPGVEERMDVDEDSGIEMGKAEMPNLSCEFCQKKFKCDVNLLDHLHGHEKELKFFKTQVAKALKMKKKTQMMKCQLCAFITEDLKTFDRHTNGHPRCFFCKKHVTDLRQHVISGGCKIVIKQKKVKEYPTPKLKMRIKKLSNQKKRIKKLSNQKKRIKKLSNKKKKISNQKKKSTKKDTSRSSGGSHSPSSTKKTTTSISSSSEKEIRENIPLGDSSGSVKCPTWRQLSLEDKCQDTPVSDNINELMNPVSKYNFTMKNKKLYFKKSK